MKKNIIALLLMSTIVSIRIKIKTSNNQTDPGDYDETKTKPKPKPWKVVRECDPISDSIDVGTLFSVYSQQIYNIFKESYNELLLVKHESQIFEGTNHKLIFRLRDTERQDKLYYGFTFFVDLEGQLSITGFLQSFDLDKIIDALEFSNKKLYKYDCSNLSETALLGFTDWATELIGPTDGGGGGETGDETTDGGDSYDPSYDDYGMELLDDNDYDSGQGNNGYDSGQDNNGYDPNLDNNEDDSGQDNNGYDSSQDNSTDYSSRKYYKYDLNRNYSKYGSSSDPFTFTFGKNDSPYQERTFNINLRGNNPDGSRFLIGSARPK